MELFDKKRKEVATTLGIAAVIMILAGCGGKNIQNRAEQEEPDAISQLQQNMEEGDLVGGVPSEQAEQSGQTDGPGRLNQQEQPEEAEQPAGTERPEGAGQSEKLPDEVASAQAQDKLDADRIIEEQSFPVEFHVWGLVRFVSYEPESSKRDTREDVSFYLLKDEEILYQFPYIGTDHASDDGFFYDVKFIMFMDTNADAREDVVIGAEYMTGIGPQGALPHTVVRIYEDCGNYFSYNEGLSDKINDYLPWESNVLAKDIKRLLQLTNGNEPLTDYGSYTGKWSVDPGYIAAYEDPVPESSNELTCSISNGNEFRGSLFTEQGTTERFASVEDIAGTIQNGELFYEFTDDGWGGTGTLHIMFLPNQINVEVLDYQMAEENVSGYGISGIYEMTIRE